VSLSRREFLQMLAVAASYGAPLQEGGALAATGGEGLYELP
jgi:hypothetical protein